MSISSKRKTPNPCQGKGLHGQGVGENQLLDKYRTNQICIGFIIKWRDTKSSNDIILSRYKKTAAMAITFRSSPEIKMTITLLIYLIIKSQLGLSISRIHAGECNDILSFTLLTSFCSNFTEGEPSAAMNV